ncbi:MAG: ribosome maturation factor RimP [Candidatus Adiutrix sp.]
MNAEKIAKKKPKAVTKTECEAFLTEVLAETSSLLSQLGFEVAQATCPIESGRLVLRFFIEGTPLGATDQPNLVTLDDCALVAKTIGDFLDSDEWQQKAPGEYVLEVSSPGLDRPLLKRLDYSRFSGRLVCIKLKNHESRKMLTGRLWEDEGGNLSVEIEGQKFAFTFDDVRQCRLSLDEVFLPSTDKAV